MAETQTIKLKPLLLNTKGKSTLRKIIVHILKRTEQPNADKLTYRFQVICHVCSRAVIYKLLLANFAFNFFFHFYKMLPHC